MSTKQKPPGRIKSAMLRWMGVPIELTNGEFWQQWMGGESSTGETSSVGAALRLSTVWSCVRLIAETIATLPLGFYERASSGRRSAPDHPLYELLHNQPNADMTAVTFWEVVVASMLLQGVTYAEKIMDDGGTRLIALDFCPADRTVCRRLDSGAREYTIVDSRGQSRTIPEARMFVVHAFSLDGVNVLTPISCAANVIGQAIATDKASAKVFRQGLLMSGTFETDQVVPEKLRDKFQERLDEYRGSVNAGKAPLLESGIKYKAISMNPIDAQLLQSRAFNIEELCRWFRVPPFMVGHAEKSTSWGTGIEQQMIGFVTFTLRPWLTRIEQAIRKDLLLPVERNRYFAEFAIEGLLRADSAARAAFYASAAQNGWMTRNEIRALENLPPMPGGDILTAQSNLLPLPKLGGVGATTTTAKLKAWLSNYKDEEVTP